MKEYTIYQAGGCGEDLVLQIKNDKDGDLRKRGLGAEKQRKKDVKTLMELVERSELSALFLFEFLEVFLRRYPSLRQR